MDVELARRRAAVRKQVLGCEGCPNECGTRVAFSGPTPARFAVLGEAPGRDEVAQGKPFIGRSGSKLRSAFSSLRVDLAEDALVLNTVSCFAGETPPSKDELAACHGNVDAQIALAQCRWVLTLGAVPLRHFRPDLQVTNVHGNPFYAYPDQGTTADGLAVFPTYHPAAILRRPQLYREWVQDLAMFLHLVDAGPRWFDERPTNCWRCKGEWWINTEEGLPWCELHGRAELERVEEVERKRRDAERMGEQQVMLDGVRPKGLTRNQQDKRRRDLRLRSAG